MPAFSLGRDVAEDFLSVLPPADFYAKEGRKRCHIRQRNMGPLQPSRLLLRGVSGTLFSRSSKRTHPKGRYRIIKPVLGLIQILTLIPWRGGVSLPSGLGRLGAAVLIRRIPGYLLNHHDGRRKKIYEFFNRQIIARST